ncbi:Restriction endonuclease (plasmid) [Streptomyces sp. ADI95-16]|uniref:restriction endonuclease n=1 Tax=Streptomyces sp. ADI95-16 TaxID=1522758 RepID=UPI000F3A93E3|nr:restriction endonuclease [Streptomyces sp. ADI95-16]AYV32938.1 Restriction endonuclease [Streptomyces sp. ADI95-16]
MHINWNSRTPMAAFEDAELQTALAQFVSDATDDDLLAAFLHVSEGRLIDTAYEEIYAFKVQVETEHAHVCRFAADPLTPTGRDSSTANNRLRDAFALQLTHIRAAEEEVVEIWEGLSRLSSSELAARHHRSNRDSIPEMDRIGGIVREQSQVRRQLDDAVREHSEAMHDIALRDADFLAYMATNDSISKSEFDSMTPIEFEQATAALARRDGLIVTQYQGGARDLGADVVAHTLDGRKIVFQCKHRRHGGRRVGSQAIQTINGTARPVHKANIVIAITNTAFTEPAHDLAKNQDIHLVWGFDLIRWATWGMSLLEVLGLPEPDVWIA